MKTFLSALLMSTTIFIAAFLGGCSGGAGGVTASSNTGAATARLVWQEAAKGSATKASAPAGVTTVRVIISGSGISPDMQQDYAAGAGSGSISGIPAGTNRTFTFQGLNAGNSITHQAVVNSVTITAGQTTDLGSITMLVVVVPAAPAGLTATAISASQTNLAWTGSDQLETGFVIERKTGAGGVWAQIATPAANATSYSNTGLSAATTYYYRIKATNGAGDSDWSGEANATTAVAGIQIAKTGQTTSYAVGDDGELQKGTAWPSPRFTDNNNGTVTDNLTGLVWLKNANCFGTQTWANALTSANTLASGACGLTDSSSVGDWHLPNIVELESLVDAERFNPALPAGHPFTGVQSFVYWSSSTGAGSAGNAWNVSMDYGYVDYYGKGNGFYVWPVRAGQ